MRAWLLLLGGLIVWTAHFFASYGIASLWPGSSLAKWLVGLVTLLALLVGCLLLWRSAVELRTAADDVQRWSLQLSMLGYALSVVAVTYQGLPALIG